MMDFVSWDDEIPFPTEKVIKFHGSSHHQPDIILPSGMLVGIGEHHVRVPLQMMQTSETKQSKNTVESHRGSEVSLQKMVNSMVSVACLC
jgi:hypothetical protein